MENQLNTGSLETLTQGQTLLVQAIKVNGGKIQLELAEKLESNGEVNLLQMFNASDERFSKGARRAWLTAEPGDAEKILGINLDKFDVQVNGKDTMILNVLNPTVNGMRMRVQITETTIPNEWQAENIDQAAKRRGKDGDFILHQGQYIFTQSDVVLKEPEHTFLEADAPETNKPVFHNVDTTTGEILS